MYKFCDAHAEIQYHKDAVVTCDAFVERWSGRRESVAVQLTTRTLTRAQTDMCMRLRHMQLHGNEELRATIQSNRQKLRSIVETIVLYGCQKIALHGH